MSPRTHLWTHRELVGAPRALREGKASVELVLRDEMRVDESGLVHGGFVFGLADYAAMLAINEPNVVLGSADVRFVAPVVVGQHLTAEAEALPADGKKLPVRVTVFAGDETVLSGTFICFVPKTHVLADRTQGETQ
jgi:acyl-coenzyme A thioesterase PaaI-like protein